MQQPCVSFISNVRRDLRDCPRNEMPGRPVDDGEDAILFRVVQFPQKCLLVHIGGYICFKQSKEAVMCGGKPAVRGALPGIQ
jgi:hypothetical protein